LVGVSDGSNPAHEIAEADVRGREEATKVHQLDLQHPTNKFDK
jgi:hypothetical protein